MVSSAGNDNLPLVLASRLCAEHLADEVESCLWRGRRQMKRKLNDLPQITLREPLRLGVVGRQVIVISDCPVDHVRVDIQNDEEGASTEHVDRGLGGLRDVI